MFGRCEIINIPSETDKKDYQVFAHNYVFKDLVNDITQLSLPKESYFVLNNIGLLCSGKPYNSPKDGMIADIAFLILSAFSISIKIIDENGRTFYPINKIPMDLLTSPDRYSSVTSYSKFDLLDIFNHGLVLKSSDTNYVIVEQNTEDILNDLLIPNFPSVPIETLQEYYKKAMEYLNNNVYITLNGYFSKNIYAYVETKDTVDLKSSKFKRVAISKDISPKVIGLLSIEQREDTSEISSILINKADISSPYWYPREITFENNSIKLPTDIRELFPKFNLATGATTYSSAELTIELPKFSKPLLIRDLMLYFTYIPEVLVFPTNPQKLYNTFNGDVFDAGLSGLLEGVMKYKDSEGNEKKISYFLIEPMPILDSATGNTYKTSFTYEKEAYSEGSYYTIKGINIPIPLNDRYFLQLYPTRLFQGKIEFSDSRRNWSIDIPFIAKAIGDDYVVTLTPFDKIVLQNFGLLSLASDSTPFSRFGRGEISLVELSSSDERIVIEYQKYNKHKFAFELFEDDYHIGKEKPYFNKNTSFGFTALKDSKGKSNSSFIMAIEPNVQVTIKVSVPMHLLPSLSRFYMSGYLYEG